MNPYANKNIGCEIVSKKLRNTSKILKWKAWIQGKFSDWLL